MAYILKYNAFTDNFDWVLDPATIAGVLRPYSSVFTDADLDIDGNLIVDISSLNATGIDSITIRDNNGNSQVITGNITGDIVTIPIGLGISGNWFYSINYWL